MQFQIVGYWFLRYSPLLKKHLFNGNISVNKRILEGVLYDRYGSSRISGTLEDGNIIFYKLYDQIPIGGGACNPIRYDLSLQKNNIWEGYFSYDVGEGVGYGPHGDVKCIILNI